MDMNVMIQFSAKYNDVPEIVKLIEDSKKASGTRIHQMYEER